MTTEPPFVFGEGLCEVILLKGGGIRLESKDIKKEFGGKLETQIFLISVGGLKDYVRSNVTLESRVFPFSPHEVFSGERLEALIEGKIPEDVFFGGDYDKLVINIPPVFETYRRMMKKITKTWCLPENNVIILTRFVGGMIGMSERLYQPPFTSFAPPLSLTASYARLSGVLSYEQVTKEGRKGVKRIGPESVELQPAHIKILEKPASVQSQAAAAALGKKASIGMPVTYRGQLYVAPQILRLAQQSQQQ